MKQGRQLRQSIQTKEPPIFHIAAAKYICEQYDGKKQKEKVNLSFQTESTFPTGHVRSGAIKWVKNDIHVGALVTCIACVRRSYSISFGN